MEPIVRITPFNNMADIYTVKTNVKVTLVMMDHSPGYCCCCYSFGALEPLPNPELNIYRLIRSIKSLGSDDNQISTCFQCREFLDGINCFRFECQTIDDITPQNLDIKPRKVKLISRDEKSSQLDIKTELIDEYDQIDTQINKVEVNSNPEDSQQISETPEILFECESCTFRSSKDNMIAHRIIHSKTRLRVLLKRCDETNRIRTSQKLSFLKHIKEKPVGKLRVPNKRAFIEQFSMKKQKPEHADNKPYSCGKCDYRANLKSSIALHVQMKHSQRSPYTCDRCTFSSKSQENLSRHLMLHLKDFEMPYKCSKCSYTAMNLDSLESHVAQKHNDVDKPFSCEFCDFRAKTKCLVTSHTRNRHEKDCDKPYKCNKCSYKTAFAASLKHHDARMHSDERPFSCEHCTFRAKTRAVLSIHIKRHMKNFQKPYKCTQCVYTTELSAYLDTHIAKKHDNSTVIVIEDS